MTASTHRSRFAMRQDPQDRQDRQARRKPQPGHGTRKGTLAGMLCVAAFIACCTTPATFWLAQQGLTAWRSSIAATAATEAPGFALCEAPQEAIGPGQH